MMFTFKRDEEGRERIYVGDACVWVCHGDLRTNTGRSVLLRDGFNAETMGEAIERAGEAGFWEACNACQGYDCGRRYDEVTVDVPVAETSTTLVVVSEGE